VLILGKQVLYYVSHTSSLFCLAYFSNRVLVFFAWLTLDSDPLTSTSHIAGIIGVYHHAGLIF
jgi:hypothetical protein